VVARRGGSTVRAAAGGGLRRGRVGRLIATLDDSSFALAIDALAGRDPDLAGIVARHGRPPIWGREPGFATLLHIVLEQQVSLASAQAAFDRLERASRSRGSLTPDQFLAFSDAKLLEIGFSRQKARYGRALAERIRSGELDLGGLTTLDDDAAAQALESVPGIGPWTSTIYLLMVLRRPDVWPVGDVALMTAVTEVKGLPVRPSAVEMAEIGEAWRPWRSVAARMLWFDYLRRRGRPV
jgi:DNA-3-methyladenine glycosylase II